MLKRLLLLITPSLLATTLYCQQNNKPVKCAANIVMQNLFAQKPAAKQQFEQSQKTLAARMKQQLDNAPASKVLSVITIPVVFHVVLSNPSLVTDAAIAQQLDVMNTAYAGNNADSVNLPAAFKPLFGKSSIQFCLAKQSPDGEPVTGIERVTSSASAVAGIGDPVKHAETGGLNSWDAQHYLNIWVCDIAGGILGYAFNPGLQIPEDEDGVVIYYRSLPGSNYAPYDLGKTAVHEVGHYFGLKHIWGDDNGACSGTDFQGALAAYDDTPNQADQTFGCPAGIKTDNCSPAAPGILYENYIDYTDDACMYMFTKGQVFLMETVLATLRPELLNANGCTAPVLLNRNVSAKRIVSPGPNICSSSFQPTLLIKNIGTETLTSLTITASVDGGAHSSTTNWTGSLPSLAEITIPLSTVSGLTTGNHQLSIYTTNPNGQADNDVRNDTAKTAIVFPPVLESPLKEGFENTTFPPTGWAVSNPDNGITWERTTNAAKTGTASVYINNYDYVDNDKSDLLISPLLNVAGVDSTFLTFQVAAATYTDPGTFGNPFDTLEVLITSDCGASYTSVYKKWGSELITRADKVNGLQDPFVPTSTEWRRDSVNLTPYIGGVNNIQVVFKNTTNYENNIYLDDINLYNIVINPILKEKGLLITPNPFNSSFVVQHYPNPVTLKGIVVYNSLGQIVSQRNFAVGSASNYIPFDLSGFQSGMYYVKVIYTDASVTQKIIKVNH